ncbi:MAG: PrsW family intramembrane metalloprotease [Bacilli bacterium]|nr:PrsW family intramembrane metalloprotease [Bacilli bacterium]
MNLFEYIFLIFITILPTILLWIYINKLDKRKEPREVLIKMFTAGVLSAVVTLIITLLVCFIFPWFMEYEVKLSINGFLYVFLGIGLIEEASKFLMMYLFGWKEENLDETYDIVLYCMLVALGFATLENILYSLDGTLSTAIMRLFTAVPGHVIDGAFMGYFVYKMKTTNRNIQNLALAIMVPALTHTIYDFIALTATNFIGIFIFIIFVILEFIIAIKLVKNISKNSKSLAENVSFCTNCGSLVNTNFCTNCGNRNENKKNVDF